MYIAKWTLIKNIRLYFIAGDKRRTEQLCFVVPSLKRDHTFLWSDIQSSLLTGALDCLNVSTGGLTLAVCKTS